MRSLCLALLLLGCSKNPGAIETSASALASADEAAVALAEADRLWAERVDPAKLEQALAHYEQVVASTPGDRHALVRLTRGWYFHGDAHAPDEATRLERWSRAIHWGSRCLALNEAFARQVEGGTREKDAVSLTTVADVPCLYWSATALGKWARAQSLSRTLRHLPTVKAYISRVEELQPEYFHYGPARYWGAYYAALPPFAGRDFEKSAAWFQVALDGAPYYLATRVLRAELLAVGQQDAALFQEDLARVLAADPHQRPEADVTAENLMERAKAEVLRAQLSELFSDRGVER